MGAVIRGATKHFDFVASEAAKGIALAGLETDVPVIFGVITTEMELIRDDYKKGHSVIDFCMMCKKCADCCPSQSISHENPKLHDGVKRWKIDSESCFTFWCKAGTDCGRCMAVCPYSHPNHSLHKFVRWGIRTSKFVRYLAVRLDDYFYGIKPISKPFPKDFEV